MDKIALQSALGQPWHVIDGNDREGALESKASHLCCFYSRLGSTNDEAEKYPSTLFKNRKAIVLIAQQQTAGHGRLGRTWHAPMGSALTFTVLFPILQARPFGHWPLLAGWSQLRAYATWVSINQLDLKWPNDVLLAGKKVSGVLCSIQKQLGQDWLCLGIGTNVGEMEFPSEIMDTATTLHHHLKPQQQAPSIPHVFSVLLECLEEDLHHLPATEVITQFQNKSSICQNTMIEYFENHQVCTGRTLGLDPSGALLCATDHGTKALMVSEVSRVRKS